MSIKTRIKNIERQTGIGGNFCACGTPYYAAIIADQGIITNKTCPECQKPVRPQTIAELAINYETELLRPKLD